MARGYVSICIPAYNAGETIRMAIASLISQSFEDWRAIIVDDASTDGTVEVVRGIKDERVELVQLKERHGRGGARQAALNVAKGKFLAMLDADDWWYPWKLERQVEFLESQPSVGLVTCSMARCVGETWDFHDIARATSGARRIEIRPIRRHPIRMNVPHAPSVIRIEMARSAGYGRNLDRAEDLFFLSRVLRHSAHAAMRDVLYAYAINSSEGRKQRADKYVGAIKASAQLVPYFPISAAINIVRFSIQASGSVSGPFKGRLSGGPPVVPDQEEMEEHVRAIAIVKKIERELV